MRCSAASIAFLTAAVSQGCTCGARQGQGTAIDAGPSSAPSASAAVATPSQSGPSVFSAPIAAAHVGSVDVVAGLVAAESVVRVMGLSGAGTSWSVDALRSVTWAPDAELHLQAVGDGLALLWRGQVQGKSGRKVALLGARGEPRGEPFDIGAAFCATDDGLVWVDAREPGPAHVLPAPLADAAAADVLTLPADRDPALVCGDHLAFVLGDGDDDLTSNAFVPGDPSRQACRWSPFAKPTSATTTRTNTTHTRWATTWASCALDADREPWRCRGIPARQRTAAWRQFEALAALRTTTSSP